MYVLKDDETGVVEHHKATGHNFDWKNCKLLDHEPLLLQKKCFQNLDY